MRETSPNDFIKKIPDGARPQLEGNDKPIEQRVDELPPVPKTVNHQGTMYGEDSNPAHTGSTASANFVSNRISPFKLGVRSTFDAPSYAPVSGQADETAHDALAFPAGRQNDSRLDSATDRGSDNNSVDDTAEETATYPDPDIISEGLVSMHDADAPAVSPLEDFFEAEYMPTGTESTESENGFEVIDDTADEAHVYETHEAIQGRSGYITLPFTGAERIVFEPVHSVVLGEVETGNEGPAVEDEPLEDQERGDVDRPDADTGAHQAEKVYTGAPHVSALALEAAALTVDYPEVADDLNSDSLLYLESYFAHASEEQKDVLAVIIGSIAQARQVTGIMKAMHRYNPAYARRKIQRDELELKTRILAWGFDRLTQQATPEPEHDQKPILTQLEQLMVRYKDMDAQSIRPEDIAALRPWYLRWRLLGRFATRNDYLDPSTRKMLRSLAEVQADRDQ